MVRFNLLEHFQAENRYPLFLKMLWSIVRKSENRFRTKNDAISKT